MNNFNLILSYVIPILTMVVTIASTVYTVNKRVSNENRETHKPYLVLNTITALKELDKRKYYLTIKGRNYSLSNNQQTNPIPIELLIKNIGYGVATNIRFYNLLNGEQIEGTQEISVDENQKLFTTLDIGVNEEKKIQAKVLGIINDNIEEHNRILCIYKDLNEHIYTFILCINMKDEDNYDFFSYQPSSRSYKRWIKENEKQYKKIKKKYEDK